MAPDRDRVKLLLVEDDPASIDMLESALGEGEFDTFVANEGEMAIAFAQKERPDLVLLDVALPDMNGFEVCRRLKEDLATRDAPVLFMTAFDDPRHRVQAFQAGGVDYIGKPFHAEELLARIRTQLSIGRLTNTLREQNSSLQRLAEELQEAKERLERELTERERAEAARAALQEQVIEAQRERLEELSTPMIPITNRVVVMPVIGSIDRERASRVQEAALRGAAARAARFVILDITGMRAGDASVADMLVRTADALRLLGARVVVTGVSPEVARLLVEHQTSLGALVTKATLQDGIAHAVLEDGRRRGQRAHSASDAALAGPRR